LIVFRPMKSDHSRIGGFKFVRQLFWNDDVYQGLPDVCDAMLLALAERK
jgi:hypothetical protein